MNLSDKLNEILKDFYNGNKKSSYKKYKKIYLQNNKNIKLRFNLAVMQHELGLLNEAEENYLSLIKDSQNDKYKINLYKLYINKSYFKKALNTINSLKSENLNIIQISQDKAYLLYILKKYKESIKECNRILEVDNKNSYVLNTLGLCLFNLQKYTEANSILLRALSNDENNIKILNSLGRLNHELRNSKQAKIYFNKAITLGPDVFETLNNIAGFYLEESEYGKAIDFYKKAENINPENAILLNNIAKTYICVHKINFAEKYCRKAISLDKNNDEFKKTLSLILLKKYDFKNAWKFFDGRLGLSDFLGKNPTLDLVKNKIPNNIQIDKKSKILVLREQGIGDEILYGTMYEDLLNNFSDVTIECDERLLELFINSFDNFRNNFVKLGSFSNNLDSIKIFDYVIYAGSLGRYFRKDLNSFSKKPYLKNKRDYNDLELENILEKTKGIRVGISWKSFKNRYASEKSLSLEDFKHVFSNNNSVFFNLQYGDIQNELENFLNKEKYKIITLKNLDLFNNFSGLANLLTKLDLFITVSNSTAHLASALGIKTILIKPENHASFHYWNYENGKTPWYESVNIISRENLKDKNFIQKIFSDFKFF